jgi:hypothetical protein
MNLYLTSGFSPEMLGLGKHVLTFRTVYATEAAELLYVHDHQVVNTIEPVLNSLVKAVLGEKLNQLILPEPEQTRIWLTQRDSLIIVGYSGPPLKRGVKWLPPGASIYFWLVNLATEFRYWIWYDLMAAYDNAVRSFREKLGPHVRFPFCPASEEEKKELMHWHCTGLTAVRQRAFELDAYPIETLEVLNHIHRTLW